MGNLIDIQLQIEKLQKQAADIRTREFDKTIKNILTQMQAFGITLNDLQQALGGARSQRGKGAAKSVGKKTTAKKRSGPSKKTVAAKYRGPKGETWSGRGSMPRWMAALIAKGRKREEFAIKA
ncbi:MAG: H-NS histone family protein [Burkholderiales bacterium]|nr:H-NS histone family protein [Burkholderiales bacterium]